MEMRTFLPALIVATILLSNGASSVQVYRNAVELKNTSGTPSRGGGKEFVLIHGGAHGAWCWYKVATILQDAGYKTTTLDMLSAGTRDKVQADTVSTVAQNTKPLLDYLSNNVSCQVVLVGHSIGGISISYAMEQYPTKISHAIFLTASMPKNNQSLVTSGPADLIQRIFASQAAFVNFANGPTAPPTSLTLNLTAAPSFFYNQSPATDVTVSLTLLDNQPYCTLSEVLFLTPARYGSVRRFYIETDLDNVWGPGGQDYIISNNPPERVFFVNGSDHSAFFSRPIMTAAYIIQASNL